MAAKGGEATVAGKGLGERARRGPSCCARSRLSKSATAISLDKKRCFSQSTSTKRLVANKSSLTLADFARPHSRPLGLPPRLYSLRSSGYRPIPSLKGPARAATSTRLKGGHKIALKNNGINPLHAHNPLRFSTADSLNPPHAYTTPACSIKYFLP